MDSEDRVRWVARGLMIRYKLTQAQMAQALGISQPQLSRKLSSARARRAGAFQRTGSGISWRDLDRLAAHFGLDAADVVAGWEHVSDVLDARGK